MTDDESTNAASEPVASSAPYWENGLTRLYLADARSLPLPDQSVHCVVTSPPYLGLRDYGVAGAIGLEATIPEYIEQIMAVMHEVWRVLRDDGSLWLNIGDSYASSGHGSRDEERWPKQARNDHSPQHPAGLRTLPAKNLLGMPWRVAFAMQDAGWILRRDIIWSKLNPMRESARDRPGGAHEYIFLFSKTNQPLTWVHEHGAVQNSQPEPDYVWENTRTGESRTQHPHDPDGEYWGRARRRWKSPGCGEWRRRNLWTSLQYFYDPEAVRTPSADSSIARLTQPGFDDQLGGQKDGIVNGRSPLKLRRNLREKMMHGWAQHERYQDQDPRYPKRDETGMFGEPDDEDEAESEAGWEQYELGANLLDVWHIATQPLAEQHFAAFPDALPRTAVLAATSDAGVCGRCGAPRWRLVSRKFRPQADVSERQGVHGADGQKPLDANSNWDGIPRGTNASTTSGWRASCNCAAPAVPATVLDPFCGSGTTCRAAQRLGRRSVGVDLNSEYLEMALGRIGPANLPLL